MRPVSEMGTTGEARRGAIQQQTPVRMLLVTVVVVTAILFFSVTVSAVGVTAASGDTINETDLESDIDGEGTPDPTFRITDVSPDETTGEPGTEVNISTTIENTESADNDTALEAQIGDGDLSTIEAVEVDGDAETTVTVENVAVPSEEGEYDIRVRTDDDQASESLTVEPAPEAEVIDRCTTITESGEYVLPTDITGSPGDCIEVRADDVTLDGLGNTLISPESGGSVGINATEVDDLEIRNVGLENWDETVSFGIIIEDSSNVDIENVSAIGSDFGIALRRVESFTVSEIKVTENNRAGLQVLEGVEGTITGVTALENALADGWQAIDVRSTENVELIDISAEGSPTDGDGIYIDSSVNRVSLSDSVAKNNDGTGIDIRAEGVTVEDSRVLNNTWDFSAGNESVTASNLDIGDSVAQNTTLSFEADYAQFRSNSTPPQNADADSLDRYFEFEKIDEDLGYADVGVQYEDDDLDAVDADELALWQYSNDVWIKTDESTVDAEEQFVSNSITTDGIYGIFDSEEGGLEIESFEDEFPDGTAGDDYGTVEIAVSETADVETENLEVELAVVSLGTEEVVFEEIHNDTELQGETETFAFDVGSLAEDGSYQAFVTVRDDRTEPVFESVSFELEPADAPTGTINLEEPIFENQDEFTVDYTFENTAGGEAQIQVGEADSDDESEIVSKRVDEDGSITIDVDEVGGIEADDELIAVITEPMRVDLESDDDVASTEDRSPSATEEFFLDMDSIVVKPPSDGELPTFRITDVSHEEDTVEPGTELDVQTTIENTGTVDNETDVRVEIGDADASTREAVEIDAGSERTVTLENVAAPSEEAEYDIRVRTDDDQTSKSLTVETAPEAEVIDRCTTITESGEYVLGDDINDVGGTCLTIAADEVVFDGDGHSITGTGTGYGIDVDNDNPLTGVSITNVSIRNFETGIHAEAGELNQDRSIEITDVDASQNDEYGVELSRSAGSVLDNLVVDENEVGLRLHVAEGTTVTNVTARENEDHGLELENSANENTLHNITVFDSDWHGIVLRGSDHNHFSDVEVVNSRTHGIILHNIGTSVDEPYRNVFENVTVAENGDQGILLGVAHQTELRDITAIDNEGNSIEMSSQAGDAASDNIIDGLDATGTMNGVVIGSSLTAQTASNNTVTNATIHGLTGVNSHAVNLNRGADETVIENVQIEDVSHGISNSGNDDVHIANVTMDSVSNDGIDVSGFRSTGTTISSVSMTDIGGSGLSLGAAEQSEIEKVSVSDVNETGIQVQGGVENQLSNLSVTESTTDFRIEEETDTTVSNLDLESAVVSLHADNVSVNATDPSGPTPEDKTSLDSYVSLTPVTEDAYVESLRHHYQNSDVSDIDESSLGVWRYDESWSAPADESYTSGVDTINQTVVAESIEELSTFGVFGQELESDFTVLEANVEPTTLEVGESATVTAEVENTGSIPNEFPVELLIDSASEDLTVVFLEPDEADSVEFTHTFEETGSFDLSVNDLDVGTVVVEEDDSPPPPPPAPSPDPATFEVTIDDDQSTLNGTTEEDLIVVAEVSNTGDEDGTQSISLSAAETELDQRLSIDGGDTDRVEFVLPGSMEYDGVTALVETADDSANTTLTVRESDPAVFNVSIDEEASDIDAVIGESINLTATVTNEGANEDTQVIESGISGVTANESVTLEPDESAQVEFVHTVDESAVNESAFVQSEGTVDSIPLNITAEEPAITVSIDRNESRLDVYEGKEVTVVSNLTNVGETPGIETVKLVDDNDSVIDNSSIELDSQETAVEAFVWNTTTVKPGEYNLTVRTADDTANETARVVNATPVRSISESDLAANETSTVSLSVAFAEPTTFTIVEKFDAFGDVALVDDDGAVHTGVNNANDSVVATFTDQKTANISYNVTADTDAITTSHDFDGFVNASEDQRNTTGESTIDVVAEEYQLTRSISDEVVEPGETTTATIDIAFNTSRQFTIVESVDSNASIELVDDDGADFSATSAAGDEIVATFENRENASVVIETTVPEDASDGESINHDGLVDIAGNATTFTGVDAISVETSSEDNDVASVGQGLLAANTPATAFLSVSNSWNLHPRTSVLTSSVDRLARTAVLAG